MTERHRVLVCGPIHEDGMELLRQAGDATFEMVEETERAIAESLPGADALLIRICQTEAATFGRADRLKVVSRHGVGCDNLPVGHLTARGIPVMITGDANSESVAEHALYMTLALMRQGVALDRAVREGDWQARARLRTVQAAGRRLLVVGAGRIGRLVVGKARALGMDVDVHDPFVTASDCTGMGAGHAPDLDRALGAADVVSLHMPSLGRAVIGERELGLMRKGSYLVNVSRGDLVDGAAVARSMGDGHLAGAAFDVFDPEPPEPSSPLLASAGNVLLSAHTAALTDESKRLMGISCAQNALDVLRGQADPGNVFNKEVLND